MYNCGVGSWIINDVKNFFAFVFTHSMNCQHIYVGSYKKGTNVATLLFLLFEFVAKDVISYLKLPSLYIWIYILHCSKLITFILSISLMILLQIRNWTSIRTVKYASDDIYGSVKSKCFIIVLKCDFLPFFTTSVYNRFYNFSSVITSLSLTTTIVMRACPRSRFTLRPRVTGCFSHTQLSSRQNPICK